MAKGHFLYLIGISSDLNQLSPESLKIIENADVLAGNQLLLEIFPHLHKVFDPKSSTLMDWLENLKKIHDSGKKVVIVCSGDPNYFSIGKFVLNIFPPENVIFIPSPTMVQIAFARLKVSWQNSETVCLHCHSDQTKFWSALFRTAHYHSGYLSVYTDENTPPSTVAKRLLARSHPDWQMIVFENLNTSEEEITTWTPHEAKIRKFSARSLLVLRCLKKPFPITPGMSEEEYYHQPQRIMAREVRAVALGLLELKPHHIVWDLAAGSGALAIEAASIANNGSVWAVERSPVNSENIAVNRAKFGAFHVELIEDDALQAMAHLPQPDRIFIGGGNENELEQIITQAKERLNCDGIILVGLRQIDRIGTIAKLLKKLGMETLITKVQASRSKSDNNNFVMQPQNEVWLVRGVKNPQPCENLKCPAHSAEPATRSETNDKPDHLTDIHI